LKGYEDLYRLRVGDYRIIYTIKQDELVIAILKIGNRGDIYKE
jgi:mRNA interferase RelE/StbE